MIKEALQYIVGLSAPAIQEIHDDTYTDRPLTRIAPHVIRAKECVRMTSLTSFCDYIKARVERDNDYSYQSLYIQIKDSDEVICFEKDSNLDGEKTYICSAKAEIPLMKFGSFYDAETFNIMLQSRFCDTEQRKTLLSIVGNIKSSNVATKEDDGITQTVMTKKGIVTKEGTNLPNPVELAPFRSFVEVEQVSSPFIFRARETELCRDDKEIQFALFEADGGAWKIAAREHIKNYLKEEFILSDVYENLVILS